MAASGSTVTVLTPNGRRQAVKVTPNSPLLQVLEEVCGKNGFNPEEYGLKFQRTVLDLTLQWRFANLPNNAKLEMVTSSRKQAAAESQVRIALQMEDGSRLQDSFCCGQSLWELITHFPPIRESDLSGSGSTPVCVYMRDEVSGEEALKKTSLKSLGLTGGSAIIRFLLKKDKDEDAAVPFTSVATVTEQSQVSLSDPAPSPSEGSTSAPPESSRPVDPPEPPAKPTSSTSAQHRDAQPQPPPTAIPTPAQEEEQAGPSGSNSQPCSSVAPSAPFVPFSGGGQRLGGAGVHPLASSASPSGFPAAVESPKAKKAKGSHSSSTKGKTAANLKDQEEDPEFLEPVDREPLIYHLDSRPHQGEDLGDLPDEFFEVTVDDVRKRFAQLKSERKLLEEAPLMTKSLREAQMKEKMERYPKVVLRVQFPDRHVLQGFFRPLETVGAVRHFVRTHLDDAQLSFYLFVAPPKTVLDDPSVTLFQADLFPGALLYFGSDVKTDFHIRRELLETSVSALQADRTLTSFISSSSAPSCSSTTGADDPVLPPEPATSPQKPEPTSHDRADKPARTDPGKVPKWLKLPGKK
ncbi:tether containing UBX domain for GLUT4 [Oryzias melastigma]|uniref:ASPSCR1 tether for SLC2A4, UBX domain containing n=1 Tax=Oryzias melastigma TaxID=30732 RepID=A0A3B3BZY9_ORYME|nr:tether containing UBX domain for GLUT4 [Oryzias melastigma]